MTFLYLSFLIKATKKILFYENTSLPDGKLILVFKCGLITNIGVPSGRDSRILRSHTQFIVMRQGMAWAVF